MKRFILTSLVCGLAALMNVATAQTTAAPELNGECKTYVKSKASQNWFLQVGAGVNVSFFEHKLNTGDPKRHAKLAFGFGFGKWFTPYTAIRVWAQGGEHGWDNLVYTKAKFASLNVDLMWDMCNSIGGYNPNRPVSIVPFIGIGGAHAWKIRPYTGTNIYNDEGGKISNTWALPISAGLQFRFRLSKHVDFNLEARAQFMGDGYNGCAFGTPTDVVLTCLGGFTFNLGGRQFSTFNPCDYISYINRLNNDVNTLRGDIAATIKARQAAEAQLPCPPAPKAKLCPETAATAMLSAVRFTVGSAEIGDKEMTNVYNLAQWMKENPTADLTLSGYADASTGTEAGNLQLSQARCDAVKKALIAYGIAADRIKTDAKGSAEQPYMNKSDWNRVVLFSTDK